jgi:8-amino-7-oxononanoate synthase
MLFFKSLISNPVFQNAVEMGILSMPLAEGWEERPFVTPIVPILTRAGYQYWLFSHLALAKISAFAVQFPTVPKEHPRVRLVFHANHTESQIQRVVFVVCEWAQEMIDIEQGKGSAGKVPWAAQKMTALTADEHPKL